MLKRGFNGGFTCVHSIRSLILYSTSVAYKYPTIDAPMVQFLVRSVGFSEEEVVSIVRKVRHPLSCTGKSKMVVDFLKESGFDGTHIRKVIARHPNVLRNNVDKTLKPKIRAFVDLGFSGSNLASFISRNPVILAYNVESSIVPAIEMLKSLIGSNEQLVKFMLRMKEQGLLSPHISANMHLLQSYGLPTERIKWLMLHSGHRFGSTKRLGRLLKRAEEKLGIPRTSDMFVYGIYALTKKNEEQIQSWLEPFRSYGWSETDISKLLRLHPFLLCLTKNHLRVKLKYFMEDLGLGSDFLATNPSLLSYSMEKRIVPRVAVRQTLMDRNLLKHQIGVHSCLMMTESNFMARYVLPYKEKLPELYENYTLATGYSLPN